MGHGGSSIDFVEKRKKAFQRVFETVNIDPSVTEPRNASLDRYAVIKPQTLISDNVLVAPRAFLQNAWLGVGANVQENCYIINSRLEGYNVTAMVPKSSIRTWARIYSSGLTVSCGDDPKAVYPSARNASSCLTPSSILKNH